MAAVIEPVRPPSKLLLLLEGRALWELGAYYAWRPALGLVPEGDGHPVLVLPGLGANDRSTRPLRAYLKRQGYAAHGWLQGRNLGGAGLEQGLLQRLRELRRRYARKVSLIGWSLGGLYARELAKAAPEDVRLVITLGSPFTGHPKASNSWRVYELLSGRKAAASRAERQLSQPPPVPTTSIFSRSDGVVSWRCCVQEPAPHTENIEIEGSHLGLGHNPLAVYAIADRLAQAEGAWRSFERSRWRRLLYRDPQRA